MKYKQGTCWDGYVQKGMKKKGNKIVSPKKNKKSKLAGRLAKRGSGAARK